MPPGGYSDDVRLATWAWLITLDTPKDLDDITESDMDRWWEDFSS